MCRRAPHCRNRWPMSPTAWAAMRVAERSTGVMPFEASLNRADKLSCNIATDESVETLLIDFPYIFADYPI
jgi:hypothetical protein